MRIHIWKQHGQPNAEAMLLRKEISGNKKALVISHKGFFVCIFWLLDLGSNQGPTD